MMEAIDQKFDEVLNFLAQSIENEQQLQTTTNSKKHSSSLSASSTSPSATSTQSISPNKLSNSANLSYDSSSSSSSSSSNNNNNNNSNTFNGNNLTGLMNFESYNNLFNKSEKLNPIAEKLSANCSNKLDILTRFNHDPHQNQHQLNSSSSINSQHLLVNRNSFDSVISDMHSSDLPSFLSNPIDVKSSTLNDNVDLDLKLRKQKASSVDDEKAMIKEKNIREALEKLKEANIKKLIVKAYTDDGCTKSVMIDENMKVYDVMLVLFHKNHFKPSLNYSIVERLPKLHMERILEDHENLVDVMYNWPRDSENKIFFTEKEFKYELFKKPELYLANETFHDINDSERVKLINELFDNSGSCSPEIEGNLYLKLSSKNSWKKFYCVLRKSGLYYLENKNKSKKDMRCFFSFDVLDLYVGIDWAHIYKAPTNYCFAFKYPQIQKNSTKYIKYICCENELEYKRWLNGVRVAKFGSQLLDNYKQTCQLVQSFKFANNHSSLSSDLRVLALANSTSNNTLLMSKQQQRLAMNNKSNNKKTTLMSATMSETTDEIINELKNHKLLKIVNEKSHSSNLAVVEPSMIQNVAACSPIEMINEKPIQVKRDRSHDAVLLEKNRSSNRLETFKLLNSNQQQQQQQQEVADDSLRIDKLREKELEKSLKYFDSTANSLFGGGKFSFTTESNYLIQLMNANNSNRFNNIIMNQQQQQPDDTRSSISNNNQEQQQHLSVSQIENKIINRNNKLLTPKEDLRSKINNEETTSSTSASDLLKKMAEMGREKFDFNTFLDGKKKFNIEINHQQCFNLNNDVEMVNNFSLFTTTTSPAPKTKTNDDSHIQSNNKDSTNIKQQQQERYSQKSQFRLSSGENNKILNENIYDLPSYHQNENTTNNNSNGLEHEEEDDDDDLEEPSILMMNQSNNSQMEDRSAGGFNRNSHPSSTNSTTSSNPTSFNKIFAANKADDERTTQNNSSSVKSNSNSKAAPPPVAPKPNLKILAGQTNLLKKPPVQSQQITESSSTNQTHHNQNNQNNGNNFRFVRNNFISRSSRNMPSPSSNYHHHNHQQNNQNSSVLINELSTILAKQRKRIEDTIEASENQQQTQTIR